MFLIHVYVIEATSFIKRTMTSFHIAAEFYTRCSNKCHDYSTMDRYKCVTAYKHAHSTHWITFTAVNRYKLRSKKVRTGEICKKAGFFMSPKMQGRNRYKLTTNIQPSFNTTWINQLISSTHCNS